jgi:tRNA pseudouridine13 synthase
MNYQPLPLITADLPGVDGTIKAEPAHFVVEEIPLYEPEGTGEHVYVCLRREGWTTRAVQHEIMRIFGLPEVEVGCAGLKDKHARATQTFSLLLRNIGEAEVARRIRENSPFEVLSVRRHRNKLRAGHLLGNRFAIVILGTVLDAAQLALRVALCLQERGYPNFYGPQRFGAGAENIEAGRDLLLGRGMRKSWLRRFLLSAYQAHLFNTWLTERMRLGWFNQVMRGDIAKKEETGGLFEVEDAEVELQRFRNKEIGYTGPIYGKRMRWPGGQPGEMERRILSEADVTEEMLRKAKLEGTRRPARLNLRDIEVQPHTEGLLLKFSLPKGAYATGVLREFTKTEPELPGTQAE